MSIVSSPFLLHIQTVLYKNSFDTISLSLSNIDRAAELAKQRGLLNYVAIYYGDASPSQEFTFEQIDAFKTKYPHIDNIYYTFFNANLGTSAGHNTLAAQSKIDSDIIFFINPDIVFSPTTLIELLKRFSNSKVGAIEARQLPMEHPKDYDDITGITSWGSGACTMVRTHIFKKINGYDSKSFFMYCDDVDLSWRIRLEGYQIIFQPSAIVFHDKRLTNNGGYIVSPAEEYYSAIASLLLPYKYSRLDIFESVIKYFKAAPEMQYQKALTEFEQRKLNNELPEPIDADHKVAEFIMGNYAIHRF